MRKFVFIFLALSVSMCLAACGRKKETLEQVQEPLSIEIAPLENLSNQTPPPAVSQTLGGQPSSEKITEIPLPPQRPYKPTNQQIQTALKNAGYYKGEIDGRMGPLTKKAINEFQAANNLEVDGKTGPKTWALLGNYLNNQNLEDVLE